MLHYTKSISLRYRLSVAKQKKFSIKKYDIIINRSKRELKLTILIPIFGSFLHFIGLETEKKS